MNPCNSPHASTSESMIPKAPQPVDKQQSMGTSSKRNLRSTECRSAKLPPFTQFPLQMQGLLDEALAEFEFGLDWYIMDADAFIKDHEFLEIEDEFPAMMESAMPVTVSDTVNGFLATLATPFLNDKHKQVVMLPVLDSADRVAPEITATPSENQHEQVQVFTPPSLTASIEGCPLPPPPPPFADDPQEILSFSRGIATSST
ncbi:hypothetical protein BG005_007818 [Podila minutissima]|nr:hypothetical protein BG005_007818 [Podila minutissima]